MNQVGKGVCVPLKLISDDTIDQLMMVTHTNTLMSVLDLFFPKNFRFASNQKTLINHMQSHDLIVCFHYESFILKKHDKSEKERKLHIRKWNVANLKAFCKQKCKKLIAT